MSKTRSIQIRREKGMGMVVKQNMNMEYTFPERRARSSWKKSGTATPVYRTTASALKRKKCVSEKGPSFLRVYALPVLLLNLALLSWAIISVNIVHGWSIYLGYAVIVTVSLRLYLAYLDHYLN
jgi:hypothetical protein